MNVEDITIKFFIDKITIIKNLEKILNEKDLENKIILEYDKKIDRIEA